MKEQEIEGSAEEQSPPGQPIQPTPSVQPTIQSAKSAKPGKPAKPPKNYYEPYVTPQQFSTQVLIT